jgi:hypothetical protein
MVSKGIFFIRMQLKVSRSALGAIFSNRAAAPKVNADAEH